MDRNLRPDFPDEIASLRTKAESFTYKPLISVLVPVYNTPEQWLTKAIESVRNQAYSRWELLSRG